MTGSAFRLEIRLAGFRIADHDAGRAFAAGVATGNSEAVNEGGDVGNLLGVERELGHTAIDSPVLNDGREQLAVLIAKQYFRADQIRAAFFAAARVFAVAEAAVGVVDVAASRYGCLVSTRPLGKLGNEASPPSGGRLGGKLEKRARQQRGGGYHGSLKHNSRTKKYSPEIPDPAITGFLGPTRASTSPFVVFSVA